MRSFEEIDKDIREATRLRDANALQALATELHELGTTKAKGGTAIALGTVHVLNGNYASALQQFYNARTLYEESGDSAKIARVQGNIGVVHYDIGDYASALEQYRQALAMYEALGNRSGVAAMNCNMGNVDVGMGEYPSALEHFRRSLEIYEALGDRTGMALVTGNIGNVYMSTGNYPLALEHYQQALEMQEELGDRAGMASFAGNIGIVYKKTRDYPSALEHHRRAMAIHEEVGNRAGVANETGNIGGVFADARDHASALEYHLRALAMFEELGRSANVVRETGNVISVLMKLDRYDEAEELLDRQSTMVSDEPAVRAQRQVNIGILTMHRQDLEAARHHVMEALSINANAGLREFSVECHELLRDIAQKRNDFAGYIEHNNEYHRISEEIRGKEVTQRMATMDAERRMEAERRERDKERALLYGALPKSVADRMIRGEDVSGDHFDHAVVMFLDIVSFTSHTSSMPPSDVVKLLENVFRTIDAICDAHNVVKVKTIGDSYMCFRGDADASTNAQSVAAVALDVMKHTFTWPDGTPLQFRVGIHIGPATAGVIGTQRLQYDVWGDTVNVASRMESAGEPGKVHISEALAIELKSNTESRIQNPISESGNPVSHEVSHNVSHNVSHEVSHNVSHEVSHNVSHEVQLVPRHSSLVTIERGSIDIKGKGSMQTYWLEHAS